MNLACGLETLLAPVAKPEMMLIDNNLKSRCGIRSLSKVKAWECRDDSVSEASRCASASRDHARRVDWCAIIKMPQDEGEAFIVIRWCQVPIQQTTKYH